MYALITDFVYFSPLRGGGIYFFDEYSIICRNATSYNAFSFDALLK